MKLRIIIIFFILAPWPALAWNLGEVDFWAYQLQNADNKKSFNKLIDSKFDLIVLEPADIGSKKKLKRLKNSDGSKSGIRKRAAAYVNIGEAEDWRWYWQEDWKIGDPEFILTDDPDGWSGNFPVAFWHEEWKDIIIYEKDSVLNRVLDKGFDGIYMDWVLAYDDPAVKEKAEEEGVDPQEEMIEFIREIKKYARKKNKKFFIIAQNGAEISEGHLEYYNIIDAIAQENISYGGKADVKWKSLKSGNIKNKWRKWDRRALKPYLQSNVPVFSVDYATKKNKIDKAYNFAINHGYVPFVSRTPLSRLPKNRPPGYPEN
ncbi:MAG: endo alpha-1,4 polygalactosaminidase [Patescibacteria group bacterium]|nr:endo alpha-1,4 polygalactosaminidase [Patescibacteria group bacterium]